MTITTVRLRSEVAAGLESMARKLDRSKGWLINEAVAEYLTRKELEQKQWQETLAALESAAQGKVVAADTVHAWLRSWGRPGELPPPTVKR